MKVKLEDGGPCRKVMHIEVPGADVVPEYEAVLKEMAKHSRVPGFRQGKAPTAVVERHYGRSVTEETRDRLIPKSYRDAIKEEKLEPVAVVNVTNVVIDKEQGLKFTVMVDVAPEFKLPTYKGIKVEAKPVEVKDADVDQSYQRLLDGHARFEDVEGRPAKEGDLMKIDYKGECDGKPLSELIPEKGGLSEATDFWAMSGGEREFIPGMNQALIGMSTGESKSVNVKFPADYAVKVVAGKDVLYSVTAKGMRQKVMPEVTAEFLKPFEVDSIDALKARIRKDMTESAEQGEKDRQREEIGKYLLKETEFDLPQSVVEEETNMAVKNIVRRFASEGATREQIVERRDDIMNAASRSTKDRVKLNYILSRIATEEKIEVEDSDVETRVEVMAKHYGMPVPEFRAELGKRNALENLRSDLRSEKTLNFLIEKAKIK